MPLPILQTPKYDLRLPSSGKMIEYRPFLVKEEKILLIAQESGQSRDLITAMKDIVKACTFNKIEPNALTAYDLEFIFLKLRAKSVGETSQVKIKCENCEHHEHVEVNIDEIGMDIVSHEPVNIMLTDTVGIQMRHIRVKDLANLTDDKKKQGDLIIDTVIASMHSIFDEKGVYLTDDTPKTELLTFVNSLNRAQMKKIEEFIGATPKITADVEFKCSKCEHDNKVSLTGVQSFFV